MWKETQDFARETGIHFTYFINSAYFLEENRHTEYHPPHGIRAGASAIGFGGSADEIAQRIEQVNLANAGQHEIASHAAGHFDGTAWSTNDWLQEFKEFYRLLFVLKAGWRDISKATFQGFRAPQLGFSDKMYPALKAQGYRYDTSHSGSPDAWPTRSAFDYWNFPLGEIHVAGTKRVTLSMDYNFYYVQAAKIVNDEPVPQPERAAEFSQQMYESYMNYFMANYQGNRAPVNIGHHFSKWNNGAYWEAMKRFARSVCGLPEVKCVTYRELADFMDALAPGTLERYRKGQFDRSPPIAVNYNPSLYPMWASAEGAEIDDPARNALDRDARTAQALLGDLPGAHLDDE